MAIFSAKELLDKHGVTAKEVTSSGFTAPKYNSTSTAFANPGTQTTPQEPGLLDRVGSVVDTAGQGLRDAALGEGKFQGKGTTDRIIGGVNAAANAIPGVANEAINSIPVVGDVNKAVGGAVSSGFNFLTDKIASTKLFSDIGKLEAQGFINPKDNPEFFAMKDALGTLQSAGEISGDVMAVLGGVKTLNKTVDLASAGVNKASNVVQAIPRTTQKLVDNATTLVKGDNIVGNTLTPKKNVAGATGEILQGKPADIAKGLEALKAIDTNGVKTYADLGTRIDKGISSLSKVVDDELAKDTTKTKLSDLTTNLKTKSGNTVSTNYVSTALNHLKELYIKTGEVDKAANLDELIQSATRDGLTHQEVNDIARVYNSEFGSKAFSPATGDPLTSVNAQLYENIRKGIKTKAREGIGGAEAKAADETVSALYNTKKLVQKNTEAVNKLQQKISERGVFEKAGYFLSKYADIATGGTIRGVVGGVLPRGAGYKTMNALDLESRLQSNLEIINRPSKATTDAEMTKILSELEK